ncbi:MAG: hypothetical protein HKP61_21750 [Dactylosporangium sp.]|nr:hypothetical protein [Dactylosporangium sp.]
MSQIPSLAPSEQAAASRVLEIYKTYLQVTTSASSTGEDRSADLKALLADPLRAQVLLDLQQQSEKDMMYAGQLKSHPTIATVNLDVTPPAVTIDDCLDRTNYVLVYRTNSSPVPAASKSPRYRATTTATLYPEQGWLLNKSEIMKDSTC